MKQEEFWQKLRQIDNNTQSNISIRLGTVFVSLIDKFCQIVGISRSCYIRRACGHYDGWIKSLSDAERVKEIIELQKYNKKG